MSAPKTNEWYKTHVLVVAGLLNDTLGGFAQSGKLCEGATVLFENILRKMARTAAEMGLADVPPDKRAHNSAGAVSSYVERQVREGLIGYGSVEIFEQDGNNVSVQWKSSECIFRTHCEKTLEAGLACACAQRLCIEQAAECETGAAMSSKVVAALDSGHCTFEVFPAVGAGGADASCGKLSCETQSADDRERWSTLEAQYQLLLETIADAIVVVGDDRKVTYVNPRACGVFGVPASQAVGSHFEIGGPLGRIGDLCVRAAEEMGRWEGTRTIENRDGDRIHNIYLTRFSPIFSRDRVRIGTMIVLEDITRAETLHRRLSAQTENLEQMVREKTRELQEANAKLEILARTDALTGLANRRTFEEVLRAEMLRSGRYKHSTGVLMVDVDDFKQVNDRLGHQTGDLVLKYVASILSKSVRASDTVARWGGDEFILLLPQAGPAECVAVARRISENLLIENASSEVVPGYHVRLSVGWATDIGGTPEELVARADKMMYDNKAAKKKVKVRHNG